MDINQIYQGDNQKLIKELQDNSIDCIITSPPYEDLRDYKGYSWDYKLLFPELLRVLKKGGIMIYIIDDKREKFNLLLSPFKHTLFAQSIGFNVLDIMIWNKDIKFPIASCYPKSFEYMIILSKGRPIIFNPIKDIKLKGSRIRRNVQNSRNKKGEKIKTGKTVKLNYWRIRSNIWGFRPVYQKMNNIIVENEIAYEHPAIFPLKLIRDHINSWTKEKMIILDPFMGSGTTAIAAIQTNRQYIGFEISKDYCKIANKRIIKENNKPKKKKLRSFFIC